MDDDKTVGEYAVFDNSPVSPVSWRFFPKRKNGKLSYSDVINELCSQQMHGSMYAQLFHVPEEFPEDEDNTVELLEPEDACKILAQWLGWKLYDKNGKEIC